MQYNSPMTNILVAGSLNADLVVRAPRFPQPGETISGGDLQVIPGGKGANQAVAAARLGAKVTMLGRVGKDNFGDFLLDNLKQNKVDVTHVQHDDASTGTAIIVVDENGQNSIVLSAGANGKVTPADMDSASFLHHDLLLLQLEIPLPTVLRAAQRAKAHNLRVVLNPAPAQQLPEELIALTDYIIPNETELSLLTGMEVKDFPTAVLAARGLKQRGAATVIVTMGANGALIVSDSLVAQIKAYPVKAVDTTAAGDAFIGGFATALLQNQTVEESVQYACACGALACTKFGAQPSLPTKAEVAQFLTQFSNL
jgi:ribokinase